MYALKHVEMGTHWDTFNVTMAIVTMVMVVPACVELKKVGDAMEVTMKRQTHVLLTAEMV